MVPCLPIRKRGIGFLVFFFSYHGVIDLMPRNLYVVLPLILKKQVQLLTLQIRKQKFSKVKLFAHDYNISSGASLVTQMVKNLYAVWETQVQSLDWEDPLEKGMTTHSSVLAWRITWTEEPGELEPMGSQKVLHD